jgi:hypothetical protein
MPANLTGAAESSRARSFRPVAYLRLHLRAQQLSKMVSQYLLKKAEPVGVVYEKNTIARYRQGHKSLTSFFAGAHQT